MKNEPCNCPLCNQAFTPAEGMTAGEHLARGILSTYAEMQGKGDYENNLPCPRCGAYCMSQNVLQNALSRQFGIYVCDACGLREAIKAADGKPLPLESWWIVTEILK